MKSHEDETGFDTLDRLRKPLDDGRAAPIRPIRRRARTPQKKHANSYLRLILRVIEAGTKDCGSSDPERREEAIQWIQSEDTSPWSLRWCVGAANGIGEGRVSIETVRHLAKVRSRNNP